MPREIDYKARMEDAAPFEVHSGAGGKQTWWISCPFISRYWQLNDAAGRIRRFASSEAAYKVAARLSLIEESLKLARYAGDYLRSATREQRCGWNYAGVRLSLLARDPLGLFTADSEL